MFGKDTDPNVGKDTQIKPGQVLNPKGTPPGKRWTTLIKEAGDVEIDAVDPRTGQTRKMTLREAAVLAQFKQACKGNVKAFRELIEREDGKVTQPISGPNGEALAPLTVMVRGVAGAEKPETPSE